jgi:predicted Fe-Mo cluster-binding NifX family protein
MALNLPVPGLEEMNKVMKIGIPVWRNRVSPLFDTARVLAIIEISGGREISRTEALIEEDHIPLRARWVKDQGIRLLICGGISGALEVLLSSYGVVVMPGIYGDCERVIDGFQNSRLDATEYRMPGYGGRKHRHRYCRGKLRFR